MSLYTDLMLRGQAVQNNMVHMMTVSAAAMNAAAVQGMRLTLTLPAEMMAAMARGARTGLPDHTSPPMALAAPEADATVTAFAPQADPAPEAFSEAASTQGSAEIVDLQAPAKPKAAAEKKAAKSRKSAGAKKAEKPAAPAKSKHAKADAAAQPAAKPKAKAKAKPAPKAKADPAPPASASAVVPEAKADTAAPQPALLKKPRGGVADDLEAVLGIGPDLAGKLKAIGIYHYDQLADLTPDHIAWLDTEIKGFAKICGRYDMVGQAKTLT